jgi:arylsulfatase A-like enzyme
VIERRSFLLAPLALAAAQRRIVAAAPQTNVILIIASGWRGQAVPWAPDSDFDPPYLNRFGSESVTFSRTYAGYPRLIPGRRIVLTGRFAHSNLLPEITLDTSSLSALLQAAGYRSAKFGDGPVGDIISFVRGEAQRAAAQPFYMEWPIEWTRPYRSGALIERPATDVPRLRPNVPDSVAAEAKNQLAVFMAQAMLRDRSLGAVLGEIDRSALKDNTLVVFTSDRGQQFGSHGLIGDDSFYEESVRIPLAMRHPRLERGGQRDMLVSQADIAPTILGLCGMPVPEEMQGRNLAGLITENIGEPPDAVFAEGRMSEPEEWCLLVHGYDKLVVDGSGHPTHLFNLRRDPYAMNNLVDVSAENLKLDSMTALLQLWRRKLSDGGDASGLKTR